MNRILKKAVSVFVAAVMVSLSCISVYADKGYETKTKTEINISAEGVYQNWDGVSNVAQFIDNKGRFCYAYDGKESVTVVRINKDGNALKKQVKLKKTHPLFGTVLCDKSGNFYLVSGEENKGNDTKKQTVFVSKYNSSGKHIATVGDNGTSSLASYYPSDFATKKPFDGGNCTAAINGDILAVDYAREMYNGHQSNSVFRVNIKTMTKKSGLVDYNSHSFAQRIAPYKSGFIYASEGDCYPRSFSLTTDSGKVYELFHFWVEKGAFDRYDMFVMNDNFAHMGGLIALGKDKAALIGTSVKSLDKSAEKENEQLFIQIFDPGKNLASESAYVTSGKRSGLSGPNGDEKVIDYGVKWLTDFDNKTSIKNPQAVAVGNKAVILYEKYSGSKYQGVYYIVVNDKGKVVKKQQKFSASARLNPCTMPVASDGTIYWAGNKSGSSKQIYVYRLKIDK